MNANNHTIQIKNLEQRADARERRTWLAPFVLLFSLGIFAFNTPAVTFPDANLEAAVRSALGIPSGEITQQNMAGLTNLYAWSAGISQLDGLEYATNLQSLNIGYNSVTNLNPLSNCWKLTLLGLFENRVTDVTPLTGLTNLVTLELWNNRVTSVLALSNLNQLTSLSLGYNGLTNVDGLAGCWRLTSLNLFEDKITDVTPLAGLTNLTTLDLWNNRAADISSLSNLNQLTYLNLGYNGVTNAQPLAGLTNLTYLNLNGNGITDAQPLASLKMLQSLSLGGNKVNELAPFAGLTNLAYLDLWRNGVTDASALSGLTNLIDLYLPENSLTSIAFVSGMSRLQTLGVDLNHIRNVDVLIHCPALVRLTLNNNEIEDPQPLAGLTNLREIQLQENWITNISVLSTLSALTYADVRWNFLNVAPGSASRAVIDQWIANGATVYFTEQTTAPRISWIADQTIAQGSTLSLAFRVADDVTPSGDLTVTASSSNTGLLPNEGIVLGGSGGERTLEATPWVDQFGVAIIYVGAADVSQNSAIGFKLTVLETNAPVITGTTGWVSGTNAPTGLPLVALKAAVNPGNLATTVTFEYGLTVSYGAVTAAQVVPAGSVGVEVSANITFQPGRTCCWRVIASNAAGTRVCANQSVAVPALYKPGDLNGDGLVDQAELDSVLAGYWPTSPWVFMTNTAGLGTTNVVFSLTDSTAGSFSVLVSTNLSDWDYMGPAVPFYQFADPAAAEEPQRYYRLSWP